MGEVRTGTVRVVRSYAEPGNSGECYGQVLSGTVGLLDRARLIRQGLVVDDDLRIAIIYDTDAQEGRQSVDGGAYFFAVGGNDVRDGDLIETYQSPAEPSGDERPLATAEVENTGYSPLGGGTGAQVTVTSGTLRPGDRARVLSRGSALADALRITFLRIPGEGGVDAAGTGALCEVFLGFGHLTPGDVIVTYDLPSPAHFEKRLASVKVLRADTHGGGTTVECAHVAPSLGSSGRLIRRNEVVGPAPSIRPIDGRRIDVGGYGIFPGDIIETYELVPNESRDDEVPAPPSRRPAPQPLPPPGSRRIVASPGRPRPPAADPQALPGSQRIVGPRPSARPGPATPVPLPPEADRIVRP